MTRFLTSSIIIEATPEAVWKVLTDFTQYPNWNPFITRIEGPLKEDGKLNVNITLPGEKDMSFSPTLLVVKPHEELKWMGKVLHPLIFSGEHRFQIESLSPTQTKLIHSEIFKGILVSMMGKMLEKTQKAFEEMNEALKREVLKRQ